MTVENMFEPYLFEDSKTECAEDFAASVSGIHNCQSSEAKRLCIYNLNSKLRQPGTYDIGGTYTDSAPDLWFYYTTSVYPWKTYMLNLFVCHRKTGAFKITITDNAEILRKKTDSHQLSMPNTLTFKTIKPDESHYIKSFIFTENNLATLQNYVLCIPIKIEIASKLLLNNDVVNRIKNQHDLSGFLSKIENADFTLQSASGRLFQTHKIILASSAVLKDIIKNPTSISAFIDIDDSDMELLLEFLYTGSIKDMEKQDCLKLLELANRFQLKNLKHMTELVIIEQINIKNAIDFAIVSEKYSLDSLQSIVFKFIFEHPETLETDTWANLSDVVLTKKLFSYMQKQKRLL